MPDATSVSADICNSIEHMRVFMDLRGLRLATKRTFGDPCPTKLRRDHHHPTAGC
jgi:hypothetical protein